MSRRDQLFQAVNNVQGQVYGLIDQHVRQGGEQQQQRPLGTTHNAQAGPSSSSSTVRRSDTTSTLPLYSRIPGSGAQAAPPSVLSAAPGQAQAAADQLPQSRIAHGTGREARAAAAALREEQLRTGVLKTQHTFISSGARVVMDIHTLPQKTLTFMGGTAERGRGAMKGTVVIHAQPNERVSVIRLKIKAVVRVMVPRSGTPQQPFPLERSHPSVEPCVEKEVLLLQLESQLYDAKSNTSPDISDPTILPVGRHEYPFSIDIPSQTGKGVDLPPSFVLSPLNAPDQVPRPQAKNKWEALTSAIPLPYASNDWASVKWYVKLTVERPGLLRTNERIFAPFVYLPPPPSLKGMQEQLFKRLRLAAECDSLLRQFHSLHGARPIDLQRLHEPFAQWTEIKLPYGVERKPPSGQAGQSGGLKGKGNGKQGMFSKMLFGSSQGQEEEKVATYRESFSLHLPKKPFVFGLRSGIPYILSRSVDWTGRGTLSSTTLSRVPTLGLFQRANLFARSKGPNVGITSRFVAPGRQPPDNQPVFLSDERRGASQGQNQHNRRVEYWLGLIDLPPGCTPCFETPALTLEYFIGVRSPTSPNLMHTEAVVLVCPPSRPVRAALPASQTPSRTGTPSNEASTRRRRQGSTEPSSSAPATAPVPAKTKVNAQRPIVSQDASTAEARPTQSNPVRPTPPPTSSDAALRPPKASVQAPSVASAIPATASTPQAVRPEQSTMLPSASQEKTSMQARFDEQIRAHSQQAPSSSAAQGTPTSSAASSARPPAPPPRPSPSHSANAAIDNDRPSEQMSSAQPAGMATPLTLDEDAVAEESHQWQFQEDELADLPPSYFEATGMQDND